MKYLINVFAALTLLIGASTVHANEFSMPNKSGGEIRLTNTKCTARGRETWFIVYAFSSTGTAAYGCWFVNNGLVHVSWHDGTNSIYKATDFSLIGGSSL